MHLQHFLLLTLTRTEQTFILFIFIVSVFTITSNLWQVKLACLSVIDIKSLPKIKLLNSKVSQLRKKLT